MKPLKLSMTAFGSYADTQLLDFAELKGRSFFLIHGPTGSGKTTILDAMCFALYGDTSGALRDGKAMRSDHADANVLTQVVFDFAIGNARYRVKRVPEQERPKKRGEGTTTKVAEAELYRIDAEDSTEVIATGWSKVTEKIEVFLGFKSAQFRQVVLLPQGDFRKLLTANSTERQEIMQTLFKTELYRQIEDKLKAKAQEFKRAFDELGKQKQWILQEAGVESPDNLIIRHSENIAVVEQLKSQLEVVAKEREKLQQTVLAAKVVEAKFAEQADAAQALAKFNEKLPLVAQGRLELAKAVNAAGLADAERTYNRLNEDTAVLQAELAKQEQALSQAIICQAEAEQKFAAEKNREAERETAAREVLKLNELGTKVAELAAARQKAEQSRKQAANTEKAKDSVSAKLKLIQTNLEKVVDDHKQQLTLAAQLPAHQSKLDDLKRVLAARKTLDEVKGRCISLQQQVISGESALAVQESRYLAAKAQLAELQTRWAAGQAAVMAVKLEADKPCPVCGSTHHPQPARSAADMPTEQQIEAQQELLAAGEEQRERQRQQLSRITTEYNTMLNRQSQLEQELGPIAVKELGEIENEIKIVEQSYQTAKNAESKVKELEKQISALDEQKKALTEQLEEAEQVWRRAETEWRSAEAIANERQLTVPAEYRDPAKLFQAQQQAVKRQSQLKAAFEEAQKASHEAEQYKVKCQTSLEAIKANLEVSVRRLNAERKNFAQRLQRAGFSSQEEYQQAQRAEAYRLKLEERITLFDKEFAAAKARSERAVFEVAGLSQPNMAELNEQLEQCQARHSEILTSYTAAAAQVERETKWLDKLSELSAAISKVEADYAITGRLAEVANGSNQFRLTFQRFVLGALLDDVAAAANERLKTMSRGRYLLQRTMDRARKNAAGGLELEVFDNYTGAARGVGTLSGGETFLASLSLALGLADVVQSYAGGICLDTILVDEGFGTLDPEALDFALKALIDLQRGGRLVGIISHIPELKERIDARLEVVPTDRGSRATFKVG